MAITERLHATWSAKCFSVLILLNLSAVFTTITKCSFFCSSSILTVLLLSKPYMGFYTTTVLMLNLSSSLRCQVQERENTGADIERLFKFCKQIQIGRQKRWACHGRAENCRTLIVCFNLAISFMCCGGRCTGDRWVRWSWPGHDRTPSWRVYSYLRAGTLHKRARGQGAS